MPLRKSPQIPRARLVATGLIAAGTLVAPAASQGASLSQNITCQSQVVTSPFAAFGDSASYFLAPDGSFEAGAKGWTLKGAKVVTGNETLGILKGNKALQLGGKGVVGVSRAISPELCIDASHPTFRFVVKNSSPVAVLNTWINFKSSSGVALRVPAKGNVLNFGLWTVGAVQPLATAIPSLFLGTGTTATIEFEASSTTTAAGIQIDAVMVDPYRRG